MRNLAVIIVLLAYMLPAAAAECSGTQDLGQFVAQTYGDSIEFDVFRNGEPVGQHITRFQHNGAAVEVHSKMELAIKLLFVTVYRFEYESRSSWCHGRLGTLNAITTDGGTRSTVNAALREDALIVTAASGNYTAPPDAMTSDHWNPAILDRDQILNTISGQLNAITIGDCKKPSPIAASAAPAARCYEYSGELQARVWYDQQGRWSGLEFDGRDGSDIVYRCRNCDPRLP